MAVADKPATKASPRNPVQELALASFAGATYLAASFCLVVSGIPTLWDYWLGIDRTIDNPFLSSALVVLVSLLATVGLVVLARKLEGPHPLRGLKAGSVIGAVCLLLIFVIVVDWIGGPLTTRNVDTTMIWVVLLVLMAGLLFGVYWTYNRPGFAKFLISTEENGWFSTSSFKYNQGQKVRRATLIALLVVVAMGLWGNIRTGMLSRGNWEIDIPGTNFSLVALFNINLMLPFLLFLAFGWVAWRAVNWPTFADFLIATEAELNKVSWTTRKRLIQDTIVVLATMFLMTLFLFVVDIIWIRVLSFQPIPGVLQIDPQREKQKQLGPTDW